MTNTPEIPKIKPGILILQGGMSLFSQELKALLVQVISSWQVITVTVVLLLYFFLVFYVARSHQQKRPARFSSTGKNRKAAAGAPAPAPEEGAATEVTPDDELGLEEQK